MTTWFIIPVAREAAFRTAYLAEKVRDHGNPEADEDVGVMVPHADGTKLMTGTSRMSPAARVALQGRKPAWLEIYSTWPGWEYAE